MKVCGDFSGQDKDVCSGHGTCVFKQNDFGAMCICNENWNGIFCGTGPENLLFYGCGITLTFEHSVEFTRISFPFIQTHENTKIEFFRTNGYFFGFFLDDYLHTGGLMDDLENSFGAEQVSFLLFIFF